MWTNVSSFDKVTPTMGELSQNHYPLFNDWWTTHIPEYKDVLMTKITRAFYFNQIAAETPERFVFDLNEQLSRIMPYYNKLYASELIKFDPLLNHSIEANGRMIENILNHTNTKDDQFSKAVRDFVGAATKAGNVAASGQSVVNGVKDATENEQYKKDGTTNEKLHRQEDGKEDETGHIVGHETQVTTDKSTQTTDMTTTTDKETTETETPGETSEKKMDWGGTEKTVSQSQENTSDTRDGTKNWTEVTDDDAITKTVTDLDETNENHSRKDYADTPQKQLNVAAGDGGVPAIRADYLTNVTWVDEHGAHNADTTQDVTYKDDITKTHDETYHEDGSGTKDENGTVDKTKGGTDTETTTRGGQNVTVTKEHGTSATGGTVVTDTNGNKVTDTTQDSSKNTINSDTTWQTVDRPWEEKGDSEKKSHATEYSTTDTKSKSDSTSSENSRETADVTQSTISTGSRDKQETSDKGTTNITAGFMNVSPSALLEAFRRTFINIDQMIIDELRVNFQMVY